MQMLRCAANALYSVRVNHLLKVGDANAALRSKCSVLCARQSLAEGRRCKCLGLARTIRL